VVGAGNIAESKITGLLEAGAKVRVVAPEATPQVRSWAEAGKLDWRQRGFRPGDLEGMFLVVAATSSTQLHEQIFGEARRQGVLCNVADVTQVTSPSRGVRRPSANRHSTAGKSRVSPVHVNSQFGPEYEAWVTALGEARAEIATRDLSPEDRKELLHQLATEEFFQIFRDHMKKAKEGKR
jgi:precorrin-2 dehydrogenase/sirohydrochlorin ferrochelatase